MPFKIVQTPALIVVLYENSTDFRQIFTDGRAQPQIRRRRGWVMASASGRATHSWSIPQASMTEAGSTERATHTARRCAQGEAACSHHPRSRDSSPPAWSKAVSRQVCPETSSSSWFYCWPLEGQAGAGSHRLGEQCLRDIGGRTVFRNEGHQLFGGLVGNDAKVGCRPRLRT